MSADVRMRGFTQRASVEEAQAVLRDRTGPLGLERVTFREALGRILAADVVADRDVPPHPKSAMDGYAVRAADLPGTLRVAGQIMAADRFEGPVQKGEAVRIMTGARIPEGADAVVMVEHTKPSPDGAAVTIAQAVEAGSHILAAGADLRAGEPILRAGLRLRPQDVAMLVSVGALEVSVRRRPRVRIIPTGNELVPVAARDPGGAVVESNSFLLEALALRDGAEPILHPIVRDDPAALQRAMREPGADLVVMTGGSSVGQEDLGPVVLREIGELAIHGVHVRPASPTGIGFVDGRPIVLAPGYPVAAYVAWDLFARIAVQRMLGAREALPYRTMPARLSHPFEKPANRVEIQRVVLHETSESTPVATILKGGAALLSTTTRADGFVYVPAGISSLEAGAVVDVHLYG